MGGVGAWLLAERGRLFPWVPVCMACGIGLWLGWPAEPAGAYWGALVVALAGLALWCAPLAPVQPAGAALLSVALGFLLAGLRSDLVAAPVLGFRYYGPVEGRIVGIDRSQSDQLRLTLDRVVLERVPPDRTPGRVRVSLHGAQGFVDPQPGLRVMMTAHLAPPEGAVEPGGFDFRRLAWFRGLGAVGYTRTPALAQGPPNGWEAGGTRLRMHLSAAIQSAIPGEPGALASAMMTGDRSGMGAEAVRALRDSSLYHLVSISGVHMGLLAAFVFAALRYGLALVPPLALRIPARKVAAVVALGVAAFYLILSGGDVATGRAFVMVALMLGAVLLDRRAVSLRSVAMAAVVILALQPEAVAEPGFQMSFAATAALVAGFDAFNRLVPPGRMAGWLRVPAVLVLSSVLAGFASAPFAAAHFNRFTDYGLVANLLASPLMGLVVMPAAVMSAVLAPLGLAAPALWLLEVGVGLILLVARMVAGWQGAVTMVPAPAPWVLPLLGLGGCALVLLRGRARLGGLVPLLAALLLWPADRPALLVAGDGGLLGVLGPGGRALSAPVGNGFAARSWLENDGDAASPEQAAARPGFAGPEGDRRFTLGRLRGAALAGKKAPARLAEICARVDVVVIAARLQGAPPGPCRVIDQRVLDRTGPLALGVAEDGALRLVPTNTQGQRRWSGRRPLREEGRQTVPQVAKPGAAQPNARARPDPSAGKSPVRATRLATAGRPPAANQPPVTNQ
ncbi:ComEC/Rec2 family competence protein [Gemmobacter sp.]|uniref:ComEC/Rec2 family competence protein n=1 Tax=Gemmobacter sp. TaxID=1898957 RepID=UPI002AFE2582|nr:ComEC/Rec2 family competence protein [Gemmobacter sp.]